MVDVDLFCLSVCFLALFCGFAWSSRVHVCGICACSAPRNYYDLQSPHEFKKSRVLVTGAAGFIGFHICEKLHAVGLPTIVGVDNFNSYYAVELKQGEYNPLVSDRQGTRLNSS